MGNGFQTELDFRSGQAFQSESSELAVFFYLPEDGLGFNGSVASVNKPLFACQELPGSSLVVIKGVIDFYLPVSF